MSPHLLLADADAVADAVTFASRAARTGDGAVRLLARQGTLVMTCAPLATRTPLDRMPTVLAMRALPADPELVCDFVVEGETLRAAGTPANALALPETATTAAWAGVSAPRGGWQAAGQVTVDALRRVAQEGMTDVSAALPESPGDDVVHSVRAAVWGQLDPRLGELPRGVAFVALTLGFLGEDEDVAVRRARGWVRLSMRRGHVLLRTPDVLGLTPVRMTGRAPSSS